MSSLLDPAFLRELEALRRRLVVRTASGRAGEHIAKRKGSSAEFADHRPYEWGDDPRRIDWLAYARAGDLVVKQFRAEEDIVVRIVVDRSASLEGDKFRYAQKIAAALGYVGLAASERVQLLSFASTAAPARRSLRGRGGLPALLRTIEEYETSGTTNLAAAIDAAMAKGRPGLLVVISDFLDPAGFEAPLKRARAAGHELALVHLLDREEMQPTLRGDYELVDAETGEIITLTADEATIEAYLDRLYGLIDELRAFARRHGASYVRVVTDERVESAVRRILERKIDEAP